MYTMHWIILLKRVLMQATVSLFIVSCAIDPEIVAADRLTINSVPPGFPPIPYPEDNLPSADRIALGKELFFDPILSVDSTISCSSCHLPESAFTDNRSVSVGVEGRIGFRNAPTLTNVAYAPYMLMDGGNPNLELQIFVPIEDHNEMAFNLVLLTERLTANSYYNIRFQEVFDAAPSPYGITRALAAFERTILSGNSTYDQFKQGTTSLSYEAMQGMELFFSEALSCSGCHNGFNFTNWAFENNGLYTTYYPDSGRARITRDPADAGKFKVPTLRNIAVTGPYMHDGNLASLEDVVEHYNNGGQDHPNKSSLIQPLGLSSEQKNNLIRFLETLTDNAFLMDPTLQE
jgi:cytochrome c peroxidase